MELLPQISRLHSFTFGHRNLTALLAHRLYIYTQIITEKNHIDDEKAKQSQNVSHKRVDLLFQGFTGFNSSALLQLHTEHENRCCC